MEKVKGIEKEKYGAEFSRALDMALEKMKGLEGLRRNVDSFAVSAQQAAPKQHIEDLSAQADFIINGLGD